MPTITVEAYQCTACGHTWLPSATLPKQCSKCRSRNWNAPAEQSSTFSLPIESKLRALAESIPGVTTASALECAIPDRVIEYTEE